MQEIDIIKKENEELKTIIKELEEKLKKYTNEYNHEKYYEKHKQECNYKKYYEKHKESYLNYLQILKNENPEKLKEYKQRVYQKIMQELLS
jgi:hypothetical protein